MDSRLWLWWGCYDCALFVDVPAPEEPKAEVLQFMFMIIAEARPMAPYGSKENLKKPIVMDTFEHFRRTDL